MAKRWLGLALMLGWLATSAAVEAQAPPVSGLAAPPAPYPYTGFSAFGALPTTPAPASPGAAADPAPPPGSGAAQGEAGKPGTPPVPPPGCGPDEPCPPVPAPEPATGFWPECCPQGRMCVDFEYLLWWIQKRTLPPLVTSGSITDNIPSALGQAHTSIIFGNGPVDVGATSGVRGTVTYWFDHEATCGLDVSGFFMEQRSNLNIIGANGAGNTQVLGRPFFNVNLGVEDADPINVPSVQSGTIAILQPRRFWGGEANMIWGQDPSIYSKGRCSFLLGGRFVSLDEKLIASNYLSDLPGVGIQGNNTFLQDNFTEYNRFYGGQVGLGWDGHLGCLFFNATGKVAFGVNNQTSKASAVTSITEPTGQVTTSFDRGLLVEPSNAGTIRRNEFSFVPEATVHMGIAFNENFNIAVGYNFLFWYRVLRPGNQIDRAVNIQALQPFDEVGPARPMVHIQNSNFWAQGLTATIGFSF